MYSYTRSKTIPHRAAEVFAFALKPDSLALWSPEALQGEDVAVIAHDAPLRYSVRTRRLGVETTFHFTVAQLESGTRVRVKATLIGRGLGRWLARPLARVMERAEDTGLERLAEAMAANSDPGPDASGPRPLPRTG